MPTITETEVREALFRFDPLWEELFPAEQARIVRLLVKRIDIGMDEHGMAVVALQAGMMPPFLLRLKDDEARHIAQSLLEILNSPRDARVSHGDH